MRWIKLFFILLFLTNGHRLFAQKQNLDIIYIGDSITQGVQLGDPDKEAPPAVASDWLRKQQGIGEVKFSNQGHSGFTTVDFLPATSAVFKQAVQAAKALDNKSGVLIFSIMLGTNDSAVQGPNGAPVSGIQYHDNLKAIIDHLLLDFPNSKIVIQRPTWYSPNTHNGARYLQEGLTRLQSYFSRIDQLRAEYAGRNPGHVFASGRKAFDYFNKNHLTNLIPEPGHEGIFYLHPNKKGAEALGVFWGEAILKAIDKR